MSSDADRNPSASAESCVLTESGINDSSATSGPMADFSLAGLIRRIPHGLRICVVPVKASQQQPSSPSETGDGRALEHLSYARRMTWSSSSLMLPVTPAKREKTRNRTPVPDLIPVDSAGTPCQAITAFSALEPLKKTSVAALCREWSRCKEERRGDKCRRGVMTQQIGRYRRNPAGRLRLHFRLRRSSSTGLFSLSLEAGPSLPHFLPEMQPQASRLTQV